MESSANSPPVIDYARGGVSVEDLPDGGIVIVVPSRMNLLSYSAAFTGLCMVDILVLPLAPVLFGIGAVVYLLYYRPRPRAIIRVTREEISLTGSRDDTPFSATTFASWPTAKVTEFRANRFGPGLYFRIAGEQNLDLMTDLPPMWAQQIESALAPVLERFQQRESFLIEGGDISEHLKLPQG